MKLLTVYNTSPLLTVYNTSPLLVSIRELKWTQSHIVTWLKEAKVKRPFDVLSLIKKDAFREAPNPKKSRLPGHFSLNCECCTPLR